MATAELRTGLKEEEDVYNIFSKLFNLSHEFSGRATPIMLLGFEPNQCAISLIKHLYDNGYGDVWFVTNLGCGCQGSKDGCFCSKIKTKIGNPDKSILFNKKQMPQLNFVSFQGIIIKNNQHPQFIT